ncbi:MAG: EamA family transporter [Streptosporangiaceae bacterium]
MEPAPPTRIPKAAPARSILTGRASSNQDLRLIEPRGRSIITSEGATVASTVTYLLPMVAIVLGVLVLSEGITVTELAGIALVLAGVALTRRRAESSRPSEAREQAAGK